MIETIYLDMDGVLVNLDKQLKVLFPDFENHTPGNIPSALFWNKLNQFDNFFRYLEPMPEYKTLFDHVKQLPVKTEILTSVPRPTGKLKTSANDKVDWIREHLDQDIVVHTVCGGTLKARYANPKVLLIDDLERNIEFFKGAGGNAILHKNVPDTIELLNKHL